MLWKYAAKGSFNEALGDIYSLQVVWHNMVNIQHSMVSLWEKIRQFLCPAFSQRAVALCSTVAGNHSVASISRLAVAGNHSIATGSKSAVVWRLLLLLSSIFQSGSLQGQRSMAASGRWLRCSGTLSGSKTPDF